ncbi:hypothetical protein [Natronolimnohabitans innermongolicus]|uniref:hypothetical protein n=1 Tax=Natronolimnohabitans innermongolicus TaxID=253107 RepID=UPI0013BE98E3|nr:hypothetical protein [Natronolimnohabitans innermongolicus]
MTKPPTTDDASARPTCPKCDGPRATTMVLGPTVGVVSPCGCRIYPRPSFE